MNRTIPLQREALSGHAVMKKMAILGLAVAAACGGGFSRAGEEASVALPVPVDLRCEYLKDPLGMDEVRPRLTWRVEGGGRKTEVENGKSEIGNLKDTPRGVKQVAYQILVASSEERLARDEGDLWDSGKVESDQSLHVEYAGKPLSSRMECFWKVKVWTASALNPEPRTLNPSSWSAPARWTMGLLAPAEWQAKWIGAPTDDMVEPAPMFRKTFSADKKIKSAMVFVSGLGYYELRLNGAKVGDHVLDPKFTRYDRRALYVTHDVTGQVKRGGNVLGVMLGNGWYNYHTGNAWIFDAAPWRAKPKLLLQLELEFTDGTRQTVVSDESWRYATGPVRFDGMLNGDVYDARLERDGWDAPGYDDAAWAAARVVDAPKGALTAQRMQPIRVTRVIKPVRVTQPKPGVYLYDLGQNIAGTARLTVTGPAGTEVKLQYAERLHDDGTLNQGNMSRFCKTGEFQTERYTLKGEGTEVWNSRFMYHGFQYVQVTGFPGEPKPENLEALVMHTDVDRVGAFESSNELLNRIQQATRWSYVNNLHGHPTDCPNREKNGWTGDAHLAAETGLYNFDTPAMYTQWMLDFQDEQKPTGELPGIIPTGGWGYAWGNGPAWDSAYILIPWYLYQYHEDARILARHYGNMKRYVDYLTTRARNGIVSFGLGDWCPAKTVTPANVTSTAYYYVDAMILARSAELLGKTDDAAKYTRLADTIRSAFNREFLDRKTKRYANGSQTALSCALYQGLVDPADREAVVEHLVTEVERRNNHLDCGILGAKYLLHALSENGHADLAYRVATQTTFPSWGHWIQQGATTLWENWNGEGTHNHVMFGDISAWFFNTLAGIRLDPSAPGFKRIIIKPSVLALSGVEGVGDLTWVKCHYDSMYGRIVSNWRIAPSTSLLRPGSGQVRAGGGALVMEVEIPPNTTATVFVPATEASLVTESRRPAAEAPGVRFLRMEPHAAVYAVSSGRYVFQSTGLPEIPKPPKVEVLRAVYGVLPDGPRADVTEKVRELVQGGLLRIPADNRSFGDPAPQRVKTLTVDYRVNGGDVRTSVAAENTSIRLGRPDR
jgi:alpha-L-rhamnosidase